MPRPPSRASFERLLTAAIALAVGLTGFVILDKVGHSRGVRADAVTRGRTEAAEVAETIDAVLVEGMQDAREIAEDFAHPATWNEAHIVETLRARSLDNEHILGITLAFEPDTFPGRHLYAPYYDKDAGRILQIGESYDYTDATLETAQWYVQVRDEGARWVEPYFAEGAQAMVADYGVPVRGPDPEDPSRERVLGTVTVTVGLAGFQDLLDSLSLGEAGYGFVLSREGTFVDHPNADFLDERTLAEVAESRGDDELSRIAERMAAGEIGDAEFHSRVGDDRALVFFRPIETPGWSLGLVYMASEVGAGDATPRRKSLHVALAVGLLLILIAAKLLRVSSLEPPAVWRFAMSLSAVLLAAILFMWWQSLRDRGTAPGPGEQRVTSMLALERFVAEQAERTEARNDLPLITVPTGIEVRELAFIDPYQVSVSLLLWQKYPLDAPVELRREVMFPSRAPAPNALQLEEIHRERGRDFELVRWAGQVTFRLPFDYGRYPFDERIIRLHLASPDLDQNVLLTPDLASYDLLHAGARPGVKPGIVLPSAHIEASYFHYERVDVGLTAGSTTRHRPERTPQLFYDIVLERDVLNAFVKNFIIVMIVSVLLFLILMSASRRKELGGKELSPFSVIQVAAAFFFVLVIAHIDLRDDLATGNITYMEYFYFTLYFMLLLVVYDVIVFLRPKSHPLVQYQDNLILKTGFWPLLIGSSFVVTLVHFY